MQGEMFFIVTKKGVIDNNDLAVQEKSPESKRIPPDFQSLHFEIPLVPLGKGCKFRCFLKQSKRTAGAYGNPTVYQLV